MTMMDLSLEFDGLDFWKSTRKLNRSPRDLRIQEDRFYTREWDEYMF